MTFGLVPGGVGEDAADVETAAGKLEALSFNWGEGRLIIRGINIPITRIPNSFPLLLKTKKQVIFFFRIFREKKLEFSGNFRIFEKCRIFGAILDFPD